jgi:hypothetical protein
MAIDLLSYNRLHHGQVLEVVVRLEKGVAGEELHKDASNAPDVTGIRPAKTEYNLGRSVVPRGNHRRVIFVVERCGPEVNKPDLCVEKHPPRLSRPIHRCRRRRYPPIVRKRLIPILAEQDVLRLEIGMYKFEIVEDYRQLVSMPSSSSKARPPRHLRALTSHARKQLACKVLDLAVGEGYKTVTLKKVKDTLPQEIHDYADVAAVIKAFSEMNTPVSIVRIVSLESSQDAKFYLAGISILLDRSDNLNGHAPAWLFAILCLDNLTKCTLSKESSNSICVDCQTLRRKGE